MKDPRIEIPGILDPMPLVPAPAPAKIEMFVVPEESFRPLGADFIGALGGMS